MESMTAQAAQTARAARGPDWRLDEKLSEGEIALPDNLPIRLWIFTMKHTAQGQMGYEIVLWNQARFISIEMQ